QAQLRDTIANFDAASQKANSLLAQLGGTSNVYGVDRGATPAPGPAGGNTRSGPQPGASPAPGTLQSNVKNKMSALVHNLVAVQLRLSALDPQHVRSGSSPLLTRDQGPQTDVDLIMLPRGPTWLYTGVNDIGGPASTMNFAAMTRVQPGLSVGGGILYSRLGARAVYRPQQSRLGLEGRIYDLRRPTTDAYANFLLGGGLTVFGGERDALRQNRRTTFGLQYQF
ncbi:MAG: hypothetical protein JOZ24_05810, partial [Candidatus Eremiobacteraeota bacterium]|nr:hypothetical protein [Candidatus Eremiobacteraeota bacterium]